MLLDVAYPNPFNLVTTLRFGLPETAQVTLTVYDMLGRKMQTLIDGVYNPGLHRVTFNGAQLPSGTYLYRLETSQKTIKTMLLLN